MKISRKVWITPSISKKLSVSIRIALCATLLAFGTLALAH